MQTTAQKIIEEHGGVAGLHQLTGLPKSTLYQRLHNDIKKPPATELLLWEILLVAPLGIIKAAAERVAEKRGEAHHAKCTDNNNANHPRHRRL
jgi:hypothetical protein